MALICNDCTVEGKKKLIRCKHTEMPCAFMRFCGVSGKYYQTDAAARCKERSRNEQRNKDDA